MQLFIELGQTVLRVKGELTNLVRCIEQLCCIMLHLQLCAGIDSGRLGAPKPALAQRFIGGLVVQTVVIQCSNLLSRHSLRLLEVVFLQLGIYNPHLLDQMR